MCASYMANHPYEIEVRSPIFNQLNIRTTKEIDDHCFSLSKMRSEIHKLKPENLEETIIEQPTSHLGTNGPIEIQIGHQRGLSTLICMNETYRILLSISQAMFTKNNFSFSLRQYRCIILQMNNGII